MEPTRTHHRATLWALVVILLVSCNATNESTAGDAVGNRETDSAARYSGCVSALGRSTPRPPVYSWIEWFADGHRDTVFATSRVRYPGGAAQRFLASRASWIISIDGVERLPLDSFRVCPEDSLFAKAVAGDTLVVHASAPDTIRLNYGVGAVDSLVPPRVRFADPTKTAALLDTIASGPWGRDAGIEIAHFNGDSLRFTLDAPAGMSLAFHHAVTDSAYACDGSATGQVRRMEYAAQDLPLLLRWSFLGASTIGTSIDITILARNRFGFGDTLKLRSVVTAPHCSL